MNELASREGHIYPIASQVLKRDFYVDDLAKGATSFQDALELRNELINLCKEGGFHLRKWASNDPRLIQDLQDKSAGNLMSLKTTETIKTLGITWNFKDDVIMYTIKNKDCGNKITKRTILSDIAKLFDPLGLLGPVILRAKLIIQLLWKLQVTWDEPIPLDVKNNWLEFREQLSLLNQLRFSRCGVISDFVNIQIHGFCDPSEKAYGACIYLRSTNNQGHHYSSLICSKSRVAPLHTISLPRLELCAALLLARLYAATSQALSHLTISRTVFWSDSTIALQWIQTSPHTLKTFVSNRVAEIQEITQPHEWKHVPTQDNPADSSSRGQMPKDFLVNRIWQHGPHWLNQEERDWPQMNLKPREILETRKPKVSLAVTSISIENNVLRRFSSMRTLTQVIAYCLRFAHNARANNEERLTSEISNAESESALNCIIKLTQASAFSKEIESLLKNQEIPKQSKLLPLSPFLDNGILKVGGRLEYSNLPYEKKHPILFLVIIISLR